MSFGFTLTEPAAAKLVVSRRLAGKRRGKACVRPTRTLRKARSCVRLVGVERISAAGKAGKNAIALRTKGLAIGRYSAALTVTDAAGNRAAAVTRTFTITPKKPRRR